MRKSFALISLWCVWALLCPDALSSVKPSCAAGTPKYEYITAWVLFEGAQLPQSRLLSNSEEFSVASLQAAIRKETRSPAGAPWPIYAQHEVFSDLASPLCMKITPKSRRKGFLITREFQDDAWNVAVYPFPVPRKSPALAKYAMRKNNVILSNVKWGEKPCVLAMQIVEMLPADMDMESLNAQSINIQKRIQGDFNSWNFPKLDADMKFVDCPGEGNWATQ